MRWPTLLYNIKASFHAEYYTYYPPERRVKSQIESAEETSNFIWTISNCRVSPDSHEIYEYILKKRGAPKRDQSRKWSIYIPIYIYISQKRKRIPQMLLYTEWYRSPFRWPFVFTWARIRGDRYREGWLSG